MNAAANERRSEAHGMRLAFQRITSVLPSTRLTAPPQRSRGEAQRDAASQWIQSASAAAAVAAAAAAA